MSRPEDHSAKHQSANPADAQLKAEAEAKAAAAPKPAWATAEAEEAMPQPKVVVQQGQPITATEADMRGDNDNSDSQPNNSQLRGKEEAASLGRNAEAGVESTVVRAASATSVMSAKPSTPTKLLPKPPRLSPRQRLRRYVLLVTSGRFIGGAVLLGLLFLLLTSGQAWPTLLFGWVLLTILADEFDGWFGYIGAFMGLLTLIGPSPSGDPVWQVILPLVGGGLLALLLVKHSGGPLVLPFAGAVFALPIYAAANYGELLDGDLILVANPDLIRSAIIAMLMGLGVSLVRQLIAWAIEVQARYAERRLLRADQNRADPIPAKAIPADEVSR